MKNPLVLGIDVGTVYVRATAVETTGHVIAQTFKEVRVNGAARAPGSAQQDANDWWDAVRVCLQELVALLRRQDRAPSEIMAGAVDSISGAVVLLDSDRQPLKAASALDDRRALAEADVVNAACDGMCRKLGYHFDPSFALPKLLWLARNDPETWNKTRYIAHPADYIVGKLTGIFGVTDQSHALKTGFDLMDFQWPLCIESELGIELNRLPRVILSGETIGNISAPSAEATGLSESTQIVAGMTASSANQIASGARRVGDWNTILGSPMTLQGLSKRLIIDPAERVYCRLHPMGYWMPGGRSNVGAQALDIRFPRVNKSAFNRAALTLSPTQVLVYPLLHKGARFPFARSDAEGFILGQPDSEEELYAAHLEGLAFVERLAYGILESLGAEMRERVYTTGEGSRSVEWMQIRADVMGVEFARAANASPATGSAIIAASRTQFENIADAIAQMVQVDRVISPRPHMVPRYAEAFQRFLEACRQRRYTDPVTSPAAISADLSRRPRTSDDSNQARL